MAASLLAAPMPTLVASVSLLNSTRPMASEGLRHRLAREGRVVVLDSTTPARAARLARALARRGFTPSVNLRVAD
ncbi:MAG: hypothetical protein VKP63_01970 [Cyanobacteriota bacterium]|nr:hypothetical protein [Cyanobacteriota bacterium]